MTQQSKTRRRAHERRAARRRQSNLRIMIGVGVAAIILAVVLILISLQGGGGVGEVDYTGLSQSIDDSYGAVAFALGNPDAPVTLVDYSDFSCPHCRDFAPVVHGLIDDYVRDGKLRIVYVPVSFINPASEPASAAMICAGEQGRAWDMHDKIWRLGTLGAYNRAALISRARDLDLDVDLFTACFDSAETAATVQQINSAAADHGVQGTPTVFVNDTNVPSLQPEQMAVQLRQVIDAQLEAQQ